MYELHATATFKKIYEASDNTEKIWIDKTKEKLRELPLGKPLGFKWFRERKYLNKRLYFLVSEPTKKVLLLSFSSKKEQQAMINFVKENKEELLNHLNNI